MPELSGKERDGVHPSFASWLRGSEHAVASYTSPETQFFHKTGFLHAFLRCSRGMKMPGHTKSLSNYDSRMVEIEVTGLCRQDIIRASNYRVKVAYSRLSQIMQEIARMGGKIKGVRMISSSLELSPPSAEPASSAPASSETGVLETEGSETAVSETEISETAVSETEISEIEISETSETSETSKKANSEKSLAELTEIEPVRSKRKSVEAKKKSTTKTSRSKKLKEKPKS
ncbi:MAG: hypothetical protein EBE86_010845 [Hormoscilla sp. GUM202]|nr:hypothetical protein [Hormoscilla sp. GUM202]